MNYEIKTSKLILKENIGEVLLKKLVLLQISGVNVDENWNNCGRNQWGEGK